MIDDELVNAINKVCEPYTDYLSSWDEIKEYYQDEYSEHRWIGALVSDLTGHTPADGRTYATDRRRIERWASGTTHPGKGSKAALADLGQRLPPKRRGVPPGGLDVTIKGTIKVSRDRRWREIEVHLDEMESFAFANNPSYEAIFEAYGVDGDLFAGGMEADCSVDLA
jgi:hypothetical protein